MRRSNPAQVNLRHQQQTSLFSQNKLSLIDTQLIPHSLPMIEGHSPASLPFLPSDCHSTPLSLSLPPVCLSVTRLRAQLSSDVLRRQQTRGWDPHCCAQLGCQLTTEADDDEGRGRRAKRGGPEELQVARCSAPALLAGAAAVR